MRAGATTKAKQTTWNSQIRFFLVLGGVLAQVN